MLTSPSQGLSRGTCHPPCRSGVLGPPVYGVPREATRVQPVPQLPLFQLNVPGPALTPVNQTPSVGR